ncbi:MAG: hypothetical protein AB7V50_09970 [Vampirovibrionia bacterium]
MSGRGVRTGPIQSLIFALIVTLICFIFLQGALSELAYSYMKYKETELFAKIPTMSVADIKEGQIVKLMLKSKYTGNMQSFYGKYDCVFCITKYLEYFKGYRNSTGSRIVKDDQGPDQIVLESDGKDYSFSVVNPKPELFFKNTFNYIRNNVNMLYQPTTKVKFEPNDYVIKENFISPAEDVVVYGKVKKIIPDESNKITRIEFEEYPFANIKEIDIFKVINNNDSAPYIISTKLPASLLLEFQSENNIMNTVLTNAPMFIIPLIVLLVFWMMFLGSIFRRL